MVAVLRYYLVPINQYSMLDNLKNFVVFRVTGLFDNQLYFCTVGTFGVVFALWLLYPIRLIEHYRRYYEEFGVIAVVYGSLLAGSNTDRYLVFALPVILPVALRNLQTILGGRDWRTNGLMLSLLLVGQGVFYLNTAFYGVRGLSKNQPVSWATVIVCGVVWCAARVVTARRRV